jgi:monoterpene epsilon-lactone hydrolase
MTDQDNPLLRISTTVSPESSAYLRTIGTFLASMPKSAPPASLADFDAANEAGAALADRIAAAPLAKMQPVTQSWMAGGTPVLTVTPTGARQGAAPLV